jgi:diguanylate cyclase (GGDEF)-like protein
VPIAKDIWLIYKLFLCLGLVYLVVTAYSRWQEINSSSEVELAYLNRVFSSSITLTFDQQEIMLDLLGRQIMSDESPDRRQRARRLLDGVLEKNDSLLAFGLANLDGEVIVGSSNLDLGKMPNLKRFDNSRETFLKATEVDRMVLGRTYFLPALDDLVIPIRKGIRDGENRLIGMMTAGIKASELLPELDAMSPGRNPDSRYQLRLFHDEGFYYAYVSGIADQARLQAIIDEPIPQNYLELIDRSLAEQRGLSLEQLRSQPGQVVFTATLQNGASSLYSLAYLPRYQLWTSAILPRHFLLGELYRSIAFYVFTFAVIFGLAFWMFRRIDASERSSRRKLIQQAGQDFLTGLKNRQYLRLAEKRWIHPQARPFSVFFIDLDNFKNINDSHGHSYGDILLGQVADRLRSVFSDDDLVCRQGGDEFIVLCRRHDKAAIRKQTEKVLRAIAASYYVENYNFVIGASIGVARFPEDGNSFEELFSAADTAMYQAKNVKNSYAIFSRELREQLVETTFIQQALPQAISDCDFSLVYQPQVANAKSPVGVEALIRWQHEDRGLIPPDRFIPVSEGNGMIIDIGHFVIDRALRDMAELAKTGRGRALKLSINVSIRQLQEAGFTRRLQNSLIESDFPPENLTLEITEGIFIDDLQYMIPILYEIRRLGVRLSLDDFGTGYSSLSLLKQLPIDEMKIDKSFIDNIASNDEDRLMVLNIIDIAQNLNIDVVAEGIEQQEQSRMLIELGCHLQQGYFYCHPVDLDQLVSYCEQTDWSFDEDEQEKNREKNKQKAKEKVKEKLKDKNKRQHEHQDRDNKQ